MSEKIKFRYRSAEFYAWEEDGNVIICLPESHQINEVVVKIDVSYRQETDIFEYYVESRAGSPISGVSGFKEDARAWACEYLLNRQLKSARDIRLEKLKRLALDDLIDIIRYDEIEEKGND